MRAPRAREMYGFQPAVRLVRFESCEWRLVLARLHDTSLSSWEGASRSIAGGRPVSDICVQFM